MTGINNGYDRWLTTPPDDDPEVICESCGEGMEWQSVSRRILSKDGFSCTNPYCPEKFDSGSIQKELAIELADTKETVKNLNRTIALLRIQLHVAGLRSIDLGLENSLKGNTMENKGEENDKPQ